MASVTTESTPENTQDREPRHRGARGGRGGYMEGRGGRGGGRSRGAGRGGGESGRGRGGRGRDREGRDTGTGYPSRAPPKALTDGTTDPKALADGITDPKALTDGTTDPKALTDGTTEESVCFICANPVIYHSIAPCGHSTCHICSLRMRALYGNKACAHCRTESDYVVFAPDEDKKYDEYDDASIVKADVNLGIKYVTSAIHDDTVLLLRYNCPEPSCDVACLGWKNLHAHVKSVHGRVLCRLCTRNKKVFTHEHALFTMQELRKHEREGDDSPGSAVQSGFKGHPECGFCRERFYSSDELYSHCREAHERCFICDRQNYTQSQQYYLNYDALVVHFQKEHFMCLEQDCLEKKFVVFESDVDLKAHQLEVHPHGLSKAAKRDARRIDMSQFEAPRTPQQGRGQGRGRDPNADLHPPRAEQTLRRDELAYQRTLAVQSSQSTTSRNFGGQLSQANGPAFAAQPPPTQSSRPLPVQTAAIPAVRAPVAVTSAFPPLGSTQAPNVAAALQFRAPVPNPIAVEFPPLGATLNQPRGGSSALPSQPHLSPSPSQPSQRPQSRPPVEIDENKKSRHAAVLERASTLLKHDSKKLETFRKYVSEYRTGIQTAREICDSFWTLFDTNAVDLGILLRSLAELYDDESKRTALLAAWNSWKAINEDYPPFAGSGVTPSGAGGARVLKIKSSTTPSAQSARQGAWGTAASPLVVPPPASTNRTAVSGTSPWVSPAVASRPVQSTRTIITTPASTYASPPSAVVNTKRAPSTTEFPSLPPKPPMHTFGPVIRNGVSGGRGLQSAWTAQQSDGVDSPEREGEPEDSSNGKKKKGKQKQTLLHFG